MKHISRFMENSKSETDLKNIESIISDVLSDEDLDFLITIRHDIGLAKDTPSAPTNIVKRSSWDTHGLSSTPFILYVYIKQTDRTDFSPVIERICRLTDLKLIEDIGTGVSNVILTFTQNNISHIKEFSNYQTISENDKIKSIVSDILSDQDLDYEIYIDVNAFPHGSFNIKINNYTPGVDILNSIRRRIIKLTNLQYLDAQFIPDNKMYLHFLLPHRNKLTKENQSSDKNTEIINTISDILIDNELEGFEVRKYDPLNPGTIQPSLPPNTDFMIYFPLDVIPKENKELYKQFKLALSSIRNYDDLIRVIYDISKKNKIISRICKLTGLSFTNFYAYPHNLCLTFKFDNTIYLKESEDKTSFNRYNENSKP